MPTERAAQRADPLSQGHPSPHTPPGAGESTHISSFGRLHRHGAGWKGGLRPGSEMAAGSAPPAPPFTSARCPDAIPAGTAQRTANCVTPAARRKGRNARGCNESGAPQKDVTQGAYRYATGARSRALQSAGPCPQPPEGRAAILAQPPCPGRTRVWGAQESNKCDVLFLFFSFSLTGSRHNAGAAILIFLLNVSCKALLYAPLF